jgi:lauroyl/myristoyl acyltransferase
MRSNKAMISRNNLRGMVGALKKGEAVWFARTRITDVKAAALPLLCG